MLGLLLLPVAIVALVLATRLPTAGRWPLGVAIVAVTLAAAGLNLRCERELRIAVLVDVSPSTRGAAFRDPAAVTARLTPLLASRPYTLHYFADGRQPTGDEPASQRTRLDVPPDADAVVLFSDGRFESPLALPPVYAVLDDSLDRPGDARVRGVRSTETGVAVDVISAGETRSLRIDGPSPQRFTVPAGPAVVAASLPTGNGAARVGFDAGDRWPENDAVVFSPDRTTAALWAVGGAVPGFRSLRTADLPASLADYVGVAAIVLPTSIDPAAAAASLAYVRDLGGTLVLVGPPGAAASTVRAVAPLSAVPPDGPQRWGIMLDASGSMAAAAPGGRSRWAVAVGAATSAVDRLPDDARVSVFRFADGVRAIAEDVSPAVARDALASAAADPPTGKTGLAAALRSLADPSSKQATRVLLLSDGDADLGDVATLGRTLSDARLTISAVSSAPSAALDALCAATGGRIDTVQSPAEWATAFGGLAGVDRPAIERPERFIGRGNIAGRIVQSTRRWPAVVKAGAEVLAADNAPLIAAWQVGSGRVVSVTADLSPDDLAAVATRTQRPATDPRFDISFDSFDAAGVVTVHAADADGPMNGLALRLLQGPFDKPFDQTGPGQYAAPLRRQTDPSVAIVLNDQSVLARRAIAGRYAPEFDAIRNDRDALARLAAGSGGAVISPGQNRPIAFAARFRDVSLRTALAGLAAVCIVAALFLLRRDGRPAEGRAKSAQ